MKRRKKPWLPFARRQETALTQDQKEAAATQTVIDIMTIGNKRNEAEFIQDQEIVLPDSRHEARELQFLLSREQVIHKGGNIVEAHAFALLWANVGSLNADMGIVRMVLEQARLSLQVNNTWVNWLKSIPVVLRNIVAQGDGTASLVSCR